MEGFKSILVNNVAQAFMYAPAMIVLFAFGKTVVDGISSLIPRKKTSVEGEEEEIDRTNPQSQLKLFGANHGQ